ncbi:MAG: glycosyltransferase family 2 protein [Desulfobacterales bacterium]|nr:glycosyltransferase family 2 protein [Desulfobacterales bacterium]
MPDAPNLPALAVVSPCYNESEVIKDTVKQLSEYLDHLINLKIVSKDSFCCFVDDGSKDNTWDIIKHESQTYQNVSCIKLAGNVGQQKALMAGLSYVADKIDCAVTIDADLQDDISVIEQMVGSFKNGYDIVYGVKDSRHADSISKRYTAQAYYKLLKLCGVNIIYNHADFRLLSAKAIQALEKYEESHVFLRGIIPSLGFSSTSITYSIKERAGGRSKYNLKRMLALAWDGITSFSVTPLRFVMLIGLFIAILSTGVGIWIVSLTIFAEDMIVPGWASTLLPIFFLGGIQILAIGIIGEYLGKIYLEVKKRPRFIVEEIVDREKET